MRVQAGVRAERPGTVCAPHPLPGPGGQLHSHHGGAIIRRTYSQHPPHIQGHVQAWARSCGNGHSKTHTGPQGPLPQCERRPRFTRLQHHPPAGFRDLESPVLTGLSPHMPQHPATARRLPGLHETCPSWPCSHDSLTCLGHSSRADWPAGVTGDQVMLHILLHCL